MGNSRPDYNGGNQVFDDWRDTLQYLDRAAYDVVPTFPITRATRPGTQNPSQVQGPGRGRVDITIAKSFSLPRGMRLQLRAEAFNAFNWRLYNNPVVNVAAPNFGRIQGVASTRTGQIGVANDFSSPAIACTYRRENCVWCVQSHQVRAYWNTSSAN